MEATLKVSGLNVSVFGTMAFVSASNWTLSVTSSGSKQSAGYFTTGGNSFGFYGLGFTVCQGSSCSDNTAPASPKLIGLTGSLFFVASPLSAMPTSTPTCASSASPAVTCMVLTMTNGSFTDSSNWAFTISGSAYLGGVFLQISGGSFCKGQGCSGPSSDVIKMTGMTATLVVGAVSITVSGSMNYTDSSNWIITLTSPTSVSVGGSKIDSVTGTICNNTACPGGTTISGVRLLQIEGSTTIMGVALTGALTYINSTSWSISGSSSSFAIVSTVSLKNASILVCQGTGCSGGNSSTPVRTMASGTFEILGASLTVNLVYVNSSSWSMSGSTSTIEIASGVTLRSAAVTVCQGSSCNGGTTSTALTISVSGAFTMFGASFNVVGVYQNSSNWKFATTAGDITIASGFTLKGASITICNGSPCPTLPGRPVPTSVAIILSGTFNIFGADFLVTGVIQSPSDWQLTTTLPTVKIPGAGVTLSNAWVGILMKPANGSTPAFFGVTLGGSLNLAGIGTISMSGTFQSQTNWSLTGTYSDISLIPGAVKLVAPSFSIAVSGSNISASIAGSVVISSGSSKYTLSVAGQFSSPTNWSLVCTMGTMNVGFKLSVPKLYITNTNGTITFTPPGMNAPAGSIMISGTVDLPESIQSVVGVSSATGTLMLNPSTLAWSIDVSLDTGWVVNIGAVQLKFIKTSISISGSGTKAGAITVAETGQITIQGTTIRAVLAVSVFPEGLLVSITALPTDGGVASADNPVWRNAFGNSGFNINSMALQIGFEGGLPSIGIAASASLPANLMKAIGGSGDAVVTVGANLSALTPCFQFSLSSVDGKSNVVDIADGALTATNVEIGLAPMGCTIGTGTSAFTMAPGLSMAFNGAVMGTRVDVSLTISLVPYISIEGSATIGAFNIGPLHIGESKIAVSLTTDPKGLQAFSFSGSGRIFGVSVEVGMASSYKMGSTQISLMVNAAVKNATISGVGIKDFAFSFEMSTVGSPTFSMALTAVITVDPSGNGIAVSGSINSSGVTLTGTGKIKIGGFSMDSSLTTYIAQTSAGVEYSMSASNSLSLWGSYLTSTSTYEASMLTYGGDVVTKFAASTTFDPNMTIGGINFGTVSVTTAFSSVLAISASTGKVNQAKTNVTSSVRVSGQLNLGGVITGTLEAELVLLTDGGKPVIGINVIVDVSLKIPGFTGTAQLLVQTCDSPCVTYKAPNIKFNAKMSIGGSSFDTGWIPPDIRNFSVSASGSTNKSSGAIYGCIACHDPATNGLLRWQVSFVGSASITISAKTGVTFYAGFKAVVQQSVSTGAGISTHCSGNWRPSSWKCTTTITRAHWGGWSTLVSVGVSVSSSGELTAEWGGRKFKAHL
ncbi:unannotated protein [freshwater metagenome]|uniref:Unannotated protein n=1 Tax=freshwater metagenome TaxID=449393 RepID=A0A6J5YL90_9ZZZZ